MRMNNEVQLRRHLVVVQGRRGVVEAKENNVDTRSHWPSGKSHLHRSTKKMKKKKRHEEKLMMLILEGSGKKMSQSLVCSNATVAY